jgi:glycosyltransferase involved in cell wall biosynthesis
VTATSKFPKVSVVIPFFGDYCNFENHCLASLKKQELKNFNIILVQDGRSRHSERLKSDLERSGLDFIYLENKKNFGAFRARLLGISKASGDYIANLDHDDSYPSNFLAELYRFAIKNDADVVECPLREIELDNSENIFRRFQCGDMRLGQNILSAYFKGFSHNNTCNKLVRRAVWLAVIKELSQAEITKKINLFEDVLLTLFTYKNAKTYIAICTTEYNYIKRAGSIMRQEDLCSLTKKVFQLRLVVSFINRYFKSIGTKSDLEKFHDRETAWVLGRLENSLDMFNSRSIFDRFLCFFASVRKSCEKIS